MLGMVGNVPSLLLVIAEAISLLMLIISVISLVATRHREYVLPGLWLIGIVLASLVLLLSGYSAVVALVGIKPILGIVLAAIVESLVAAVWMWNSWVRHRRPLPQGLYMILIAGFGVAGFSPFPNSASWISLLVVVIGGITPGSLILGIIWAYRRQREQ